MTKKMHDSNKRIAFPIRLFDESSVAIPDEIHVCPVGEWDHPWYGKMVITSESIAEFVSNFKSKVRRDIPITAGHDNGGNGGELPAIGWFKELIDRGVNGLYAIVEWTEEGKDLLRKKAFKYFSPELYFEYSDPETGETYKHVLVGGALTNKPYFKKLEPVAAFSEPSIINQFNFEESIMDIQTILAKDKSTLTDEEKAFLIEHKSELSDDQKKDYGIDVTTEEETPEETPETPEVPETPETPETPEVPETPETPETPEAPVVASEKMVQMSATEVAVLKDQADKGAQAFAELEKMRLEKKVSALVFNETTKTGVFLPKEKDAVVSFMTELSEKQRDQFINIVNKIPKTSLFSEVGTGDPVETDMTKQIKAKVQDVIKASDGKMKFSEALRKVLKDNPELQSYSETVESEE